MSATKEPRLDIKDFILIGGGILIAMVIGHGFWIAIRAKRETLRMDIVPGLILDDAIDDIERLRGELPNGPARVRRYGDEPQPENLELNLTPPTLTDRVAEPSEATARQGRPSRPVKVAEADDHESAGPDPVLESVTAAAAQPTAERAEVREVQIPTGSQATPRERPRGAKNPALERSLARRRTRADRPERPSNVAAAHAAEAPEREAESSGGRMLDLGVEELLVLNLLAPRGTRFEGEGIVNALRAQGLRYGDMNIFHRVDPATKAKVFSVANAIEPGTFDLADLDSLRCPGMSFFLQLPGPDDAISAFEDMLEAARKVMVALGGELRDENMSVLSGQTAGHMRQRISDYSRRRLSRRANTLG